MQASPYGLETLWMQGDFVTKGVAILLVSMSIASWYV
ncbi:MAG TPA: MotA/TolQ/ExbB proton channel family protein, partial [Noviherbaspirillum sp.]|nr:MotA/TolQ/ExbB proton channel family protein [Noviherbaspirillum sp.]